MKVHGVLVWVALSGGLVTVLQPGTAARQQAITVSAADAKLHNRQMTPLAEGARKGLQLDERQGDGLAWWPQTTIGNGVIEFDVRGKDVLQKSFVGVAFHGVDENTFDAIYFRPFNFKAEDPARRSHAVQYISHPTYTWDKLRAERPGQFEHELAGAPDPNGWFHVRVVLKQPAVSVFVNDQSTPCLQVNQLNDRKSGWVGVWVGNGSGGSFANVTVTPAR